MYIVFREDQNIRLFIGILPIVWNIGSIKAQEENVYWVSQERVYAFDPQLTTQFST